MQRLFSVGLAVKSSQPTPLAAQMTSYRGRNLRFAALRFSPHSTVSAAGARVSDSRLLVALHKEGAAIVSQGGRESRIEPGDLFIVDPCRPFSIETGEIRVHSVYVQPSALRALVPDLDSLTAMAIRCNQGPGAMFRAAIDELVTLTPSLDEAVADRVADALPYMLALALASLERKTDRMPSHLKLLHKHRITRFVRDNLCDVGLDANMIATGVNLSPRHVYQLFADEPESLMTWVWSERLDRCKRDLAEPTLGSRTIGEIAYNWGFSDLSHFSRSFKLRFGTTPREYRKGVAPRGVAEPMLS
jgi:AraC-like DNA-binding protein